MRLLNLDLATLFWQRVTFSKITKAFFTIALLHCIIQVALEVFAFSINASALGLLQSIVAVSRVASAGDGIVVYNDQNLTICTGVPNANNCHVVWSARGADSIDPVAPATPVAAVPDSSTGTTAKTANAGSVGFQAGGVVAVAASQSKGFDPASAQTDAASPTATHVSSSPAHVIKVSFNPDTGNNGHFDLPLLSDAGTITTQLKRDADASFQRKVNSTGGFLGVLISDSHLAGGSLLATPACIASLEIPIQTLRNTKRVDLTFIAFQIWVLGMSVVALLNESVPHIMASLLTHLLATAWSGYQLQATSDFRAQVTRLIVGGPCQTNLFPEYWKPRRDAEIAVVVLNSAVMVAIAFLSYRLMKSFGWQTFKRIGASFIINRVYQLVLAFSIAIQLSVFFIGANVTLWIDQLYNGNVARYAIHRGLYEVVYIFVLSVLLPWLTMGWFAVRRESRFWVHVFIILGLLMISGWALMFASTTFLWTFKMWDFFAVMTVSAALLLTATVILAIVCRLNFGKGLVQHLNVLIPEDADYSSNEKGGKYGDDEKDINFPSSDGSPIPTFSHVFGTGVDALPSLMRLASVPARGGPRINMHARGLSRDEPLPPAYPAPAALSGGRPLSTGSRVEMLSPMSSYSTEGDLVHRESDSSQHSHESADGAMAAPRGQSVDGGRTGGGRRWLIE